MDEGGRVASRGVRIGSLFAAAAGLAGVALLIVATADGGSGFLVPVAFLAAYLASALFVVGVLWSTTTWLVVELPTLVGGLAAAVLVVAVVTGDPVGDWLRSPALWVGIALSVVVAARSGRLRTGGRFRVLGAIVVGLAGVLVALILMGLQVYAWFLLRGPYGP